MANKLLFTFQSAYRTNSQGLAKTYEVKHDDTPPYAAKVFDQETGQQLSADNTAGDYPPNVGTLYNSTNYAGATLKYRSRNAFPYAELAVEQALSLVAKTVTHVQQAGSAQGAVELQAAGGVQPYSYRKDGGSWQGAALFSSLAAGAYIFEVQDVQGAKASAQVQITQPDGVTLRVECNGYNRQQVVSVGTGGERWGEVVEYNAGACGYVEKYGCTDPDATNYDPTATIDNGTCEFPQKLDAAFPASLGVAGNPLELVLQSSATGKVPVKASAAIVLGPVSLATVLTINGQVFRFSEEPGAAEFYNADTLAAALMDNEVIAGRYTIAVPEQGQVLLTALATGSRHTPVISVSDASSTVAITAGVDALRSQAKEQWGCYAELWACSGTYGSAVDKTTGVFADRFERGYAPANDYRFDVASSLRLLLSHGLFSEAGRLVPYYLRYGEVYVDESGYRRRFPVGESAVLWALDGALPYPALNDLPATLLLSQAPALAAPKGLASYAEALYVLCAGGTRLWVECTYTSASGASSAETTIDATPASGGVQKLPLQAVLSRAGALGSVKVTMAVKATLGAATTTLATRTLRLAAPTGRERCLVFLSSLSAYETFWCQGYSEAQAKRSAAFYSRGIAGQPSVSTRAAGIQRVEVNKAERLHSGLLDAASFDFLLTELCASPEVYLYEAGGYRSANITEVNPTADPVSGEYYLQLSVEPGLPHNPIAS